MKVSDLAKAAGVSPHAVRYYAEMGLLRPLRRPGNRYRAFETADVRRLEFIRRAQRLGFSLKEIGTIFDLSRQGKTPCPMVRNIMQQRIPDAARDLKAVASLLHRMQAAARIWRGMPDGVPDGDSICHLIEAADEEVL